MDRRKFLAIAGGGVVLAAGGGVASVVTRKPSKALEPWQRAGASYTEPRRRALSYAILAPNPHNRQPWLIDLSTQDEITLKVDTNRLLPHTDPFNRQITIGLGCFLEVLRMAAAEDGYRVNQEIFPAGSDPEKLDDRIVARIRLGKDEAIQKDPLFAHVLTRRSLKEPYDLTRPVDSETLREIEKAAKTTRTIASSHRTSVDGLRKLTRDALIVETNTPRTFKESVDLFRIGKAEIEANPDGIDFSGPLFETLHLTGQMTREGTLDTSSSMFAQGRAAVLENTDTAMAHVWQITRTNTRIDQINAGRDWVRINLAATAAGVGTQPLSQALQEFPEVEFSLNPSNGKLFILGHVMTEVDHQEMLYLLRGLPFEIQPE